MTKLEFAITVDAPMRKVYEYTVNPNHWTAWYPGTTQVDGAPLAPRPGDVWHENVTVAGLPLRFQWRAASVEAPRAWTLDGTATIKAPFGLNLDGGTATLTYQLSEESGRTRLQRNVIFQFANPLLGLANNIFLKPMIAKELQAGLQKLKGIIEALPEPH